MAANEYRFQGKKRERLPRHFDKLIANPDDAEDRCHGGGIPHEGGDRRIVAGFTVRRRLDNNFPIHRLCYDHRFTTAQKLSQCIDKAIKDESPLVDEFGMTPFHVLFSTIGANPNLLVVLLDKLPYSHLLYLKDVNGKLATDYLLSNWSRENKILLQRTLHSWMFRRLERWGAKSWRNRIFPLVNNLLAEDDDEERRMAMFREAWSVFKQYKAVEATTVLEMALWKGQLKGGRTKDGSKRQALDRDECRGVCGTDIVIPSVRKFLGNVVVIE
ncbi:unnamed protein product [Cylindrotheca closterium]|uniref:Uncharacterized protein n=1 Tax=Cylindrotheca closterium TaxID=2856 RepID=A0AAD2JIP1_9STRA|nr:unnamed protein product [Cylindrotheca closterium]